MEIRWDDGLVRFNNTTSHFIPLRFQSFGPKAGDYPPAPPSKLNRCAVHKADLELHRSQCTSDFQIFPVSRVNHYLVFCSRSKTEFRSNGKLNIAYLPHNVHKVLAEVSGLQALTVGQSEASRDIQGFCNCSATSSAERWVGDEIDLQDEGRKTKMVQMKKGERNHPDVQSVDQSVQKLSFED